MALNTLGQNESLKTDQFEKEFETNLKILKESKDFDRFGKEKEKTEILNILKAKPISNKAKSRAKLNKNTEIVTRKIKENTSNKLNKLKLEANLKESKNQEQAKKVVDDHKKDISRLLEQAQIDENILKADNLLSFDNLPNIASVERERGLFTRIDEKLSPNVESLISETPKFVAAESVIRALGSLDPNPAILGKYKSEILDAFVDNVFSKDVAGNVARTIFSDF